MSKDKSARKTPSKKKAVKPAKAEKEVPAKKIATPKKAPAKVIEKVGKPKAEAKVEEVVKKAAPKAPKVRKAPAKKAIPKRKAKASPLPKQETLVPEAPKPAERPKVVEQVAQPVAAKPAAAPAMPATETPMTEKTGVGLAEPKFELYKDKSEKFRFRLKARNGEIIATGEAYNSKEGCLNGIESMKRNAPTAAIVEVEPVVKEAQIKAPQKAIAVQKPIPKVKKVVVPKVVRVSKPKPVPIKSKAAPMVMKAYGGDVKQRVAKGFSYSELKAAGVTKERALRSGLRVDSRRKTSHEQNVKLLESIKPKAA